MAQSTIAGYLICKLTPIEAHSHIKRNIILADMLIHFKFMSSGIMVRLPIRCKQFCGQYK